MNKKISYKDIIGKKFGKWKVLKYEGFVNSSIPKYKWQGTHYYRCICKCGNIRSIPLNNLTSGMSKGCPKCAHITHGLAGTYLYHVWQRIMDNNKNKNIKVSKRWFDVTKFVFDINKHLGSRPSKRYKFVIKDLKKGFFINNVIWSINIKNFN